jgi:hypothetical protein
VGQPTIGSTKSSLRWHNAAVVAVALAYAWTAGGLHSFTWPAVVSTSLGGLAIMVVAGHHRSRPATARATRDGLVAWTAWLAAVTGWELWALSGQPRSTHPTISSLTDALIETHPGRALAVLCWLVLGWWLARR